jgi:hypothetical protein
MTTVRKLISLVISLILVLMLSQPPWCLLCGHAELQHEQYCGDGSDCSQHPNLSCWIVGSGQEHLGGG